MNRHTKAALYVAPFLILGGYIASDFYIEQKAQESRIFELVPQGHCDVMNKKCILVAGEFKVNVYEEAEQTVLNSTFPIDKATFFIVDKEITAYQMKMQDSPYYWQQTTELRERVSEVGQSQKLRLILNIKGGQYISEFYTQTTR